MRVQRGVPGRADEEQTSIGQQDRRAHLSD
jgi:hypothetical protein